MNARDAYASAQMRDGEEVLENLSDLDDEEWDLIAAFEELVADCFNRPLLVALCDRFASEAKGDKRRASFLQLYAQAKRSLQLSVVARAPTLDASIRYFRLKQLARRSLSPLLESIATGKLAAAVSQAFVGSGHATYGEDARARLNELLGSKLRDLATLSKWKQATFAESVCLAISGRAGAPSDAVSLLADFAQSDSGRRVVTCGIVALDPRSRAVINAGVGIANEVKDDLVKGRRLFSLILEIHPGFFAARLSAFHNGVMFCARQAEPQAPALEAMKEHLTFCLRNIPAPPQNAYLFSKRDAELLRDGDLASISNYCQARKSAPIRAYAEFALEQLEQFCCGRIDASVLADACASFSFPETRSESGIVDSFCCAVENGWRGEMSSAVRMRRDYGALAVRSAAVRTISR